MDEQVHGLLAIALDRFTLLIAGGIYMALRGVQRSQIVSRSGFYRRLLPILPEILGCALSSLGGIPAVEGEPLAVRIAAGLWCGYLAQRFHKVLGQTILGDDPKIRARTDRCAYCGRRVEEGGECKSCGSALIGPTRGPRLGP